jgi:hypothetical protein
MIFLLFEAKEFRRGASYSPSAAAGDGSVIC